MFLYSLVKLILQRKILLTKQSFVKKQKSLEFTGQVGLIVFHCNVAHVFHLEMLKRVGAEIFIFVVIKKL